MKIITLNQAYYFNINKITRSFFVCKIVYFEENIYNISPEFFSFSESCTTPYEKFSCNEKFDWTLF